jgi:hypothetical protein
MKKQIASFTVIAATLLSALPLMAQQKRVSPHETISTVLGDRRTGNRITITYGRPYTKDPRSGEARKVWGTLVPFDKPWRMGADEATSFITQQPIEVGETTIPAGAYTLYLIPSESGAAKLAFSTRIGQWGIPVDESHDQARVEAKKYTLEKPVDQFTITFEKEGADAVLLKMAWEETQYSVRIALKK